MSARSVLVTGGNRGIGHAIARAFADAGDRVAVTYRSKPPEDADLLALPCDVTRADEVAEAFRVAEREHGPVEVLVANAGVTHDTLLLRMDDRAWSDVLDTNLTGAWRVVRAAAPAMVRARRGRIVLVSSVVGLSGSAGQVNYAASKAALVGLARSLARELGSRNVTVNVVAPGFVATDMTADLPERRRAEILEQTPLRRIAAPEEVASVVTFLAGEGAGFVTGAVVPVDGGLGMGH